MTDSSAPVLSGFHPDPTITRGHDGAYYLVTSTFEYLPALPVHRSTDLVTWILIGHVATRDDQVGLADVPTPGGVWAPTIRYRDGTYYVIVSVFLGGRGCVVFTTSDPEGPWSDGMVVPAVDGIDPDLAWDDDGTAIVTFARFPDPIQQVRVDLETGLALAPVTAVWGGTGLMAPEGPHLYRIGDWWYLLLAEGGTDRGHAVTVARSRRPDGPFDESPGNPVLTAAGTASPVQNTGHADLFEGPDGRWSMVLLGVRPVGPARAFSPLGRETFLTGVEWSGGWPTARLPVSARAEPGSVAYDFRGRRGVDDPGWLAVRCAPDDLVATSEDGLVLVGRGRTMDAPAPVFVGRRQRHLGMTVTAVLDVSRGMGGLAVRNSETNWFGLHARREGSGVVVTATAAVSSFSRTWTAELPDGDVELRIQATPPPTRFEPGALGGDRIRLLASSAGATDTVLLTELDGRHWAFETAMGFTGRVFGVFAVEGEVTVRSVGYSGSDGEGADA